LAISYGLFGSHHIDDNLSVIGVETYPILKLSSQLNQLVLRSNHEFLLAIEGDSHFDIDLMRTSLEFKNVVADILKLEHDPEIEQIQNEYQKYIDTAVDVGRRALKAPEDGQQDIVTLSQLSNNITQRIEAYHNNRERAFTQAIEKIAATTKTFKHLFGLQGFILLIVFGILVTIVMDLLKALHDLVERTHFFSEGKLEEKIVVERGDEMGSLQSAIETMRSSLRSHIEDLDSKVKERTLSLNSTQKELLDILNTVEEGIFTFNPDCSLNIERSRQTDLLLDDRLHQSPSVMDLFELSPEQRVQFVRWLGVMCSPLGLSQWDKYAQLCPIISLQIEHDNTTVYLSLRYKPILQDGRLIKIMALAKNISEQHEAERVLNISRQEQAWEIERILGLVSYGRHDADMFLLRFDQCLAVQKAWRNGSQPIHQLMLLLHTLRGNCGTFGFDHLSDLILQAENQVRAVSQTEPSKSPVEHLSNGSIWVALEKEKLKLFSLRNHIYQSEIGSISIDEENYHQVIKDLSAQEMDKETLLMRLKNLDAQKFGTLIRRYEKLITRLKRDLNKSLKDLVVEHGEVFIGRKLFSKLDPLFVHLVRNALVHGIESDAERQKLNKGHGQLILRVLKQDHQLVFEVEDDGRGIDIALIRQKCFSLGLVDESTAAKMSEEDWGMKIFDLGFSTRLDVTAEAGRGLGLNVVREEVEKLGGTLTLRQESGRGCTFSMAIPI
jgi:signal transduction histidine kinase